MVISVICLVISVILGDISKLTPFVQGWHRDDPEDENNAPTLFSYKQTVVIKEREQRRLERELCKVFSKI